MKQRILLVGGHSKARALALSLIRNGYDVTIINQNEQHCQELARLPKASVICGDGSKPFVLEEANARYMDMAIALTSKDEDNLVICELCKKRFHIKKTVSLLSDPHKTEFFYASGIDRVVCAISAITGIIEQQALMDEMTQTIPLKEGRLKITETSIDTDDPAAGKLVMDLSLPSSVIIGCILRNEDTLVPRGDTRILAGDSLILICGNNQEISALKQLKLSASVKGW